MWERLRDKSKGREGKEWRVWIIQWMIIAIDRQPVPSINDHLVTMIIMIQKLNWRRGSLREDLLKNLDGLLDIPFLSQIFAPSGVQALPFPPSVLVCDTNQPPDIEGKHRSIRSSPTSPIPEQHSKSRPETEKTMPSNDISVFCYYFLNHHLLLHLVPLSI